VARRYWQRTLDEALDHSGVRNSRLRAFLAAEFGNYGLVPKQAPFFLHAGILNHFMEEGGFTAVGGSDAYASALVPAILEAGGVVLVRAPVERIVVERGRAVAVELQGGKGRVRARRSVISAAGVEVTYRKLLEQTLVDKIGGPPKCLAASESCGTAHHVYGFVGFEGSSEELQLPSYNIWSFPLAPRDSRLDLNAIWNRLHGSAPGVLPDFLASDEAADKAQIPAFISFPSAKDATYNERCPGKSTAVVITEGRASYFGGAGPHSKRGEDYEAVKRRYRTAVLNAVKRHFPRLAGRISYVDIGTPWSNIHYLWRAGSYGLDQDAARFLDGSLRTAVPNIQGLYLTGQDLFVGGLFPQPISALITFAKVMGLTSPDLWLVLGDLASTLLRRFLFDRTYTPAKP